MADVDGDSNGAPDSSVAKAMEHVVRSAILQVLGERQRASPREIAMATQVPRSTVNDHLRRLREEGLVECVEEKAKRGAMERFYRAASEALFVEDDELAGFDPRKRKQASFRILRSALHDASAALSGRNGDPLPGELFSSARAWVDRQGWTELVAIHRRTVEEMERVRQESSERLRAGDGEPIRTSSSVFLFEIPPSSS